MECGTGDNYVRQGTDLLCTGRRSVFLHRPEGFDVISIAHGTTVGPPPVAEISKILLKVFTHLHLTDCIRIYGEKDERGFAPLRF